MRRVRWLGLSPKSATEKYMWWRTISVESSSMVSPFQRALFHSQTKAAYWCILGGKNVSFAPSELLYSKRFIHATGVCFSVERDHYEILGISKDANRDEIKKAYHALAKKYHPDVNKNSPSAKRKFQEIRDAYETLRDPEKKTIYDMTREGSRRTRDTGYSSGGQFKYAHGANFSDSFNKIFSEIFENESESMAGDIQVDLAVTFSEAARGCTKHLSFSADVPCDSCDGQGHPLDAEPQVCSTCQGIGRVTIPPFVTTCSTCKGNGRIIKEYCLKCKGSGVFKGTKNVKMTIPAGVDSGDTIRVPKAGNAGGRGKSPGNLYIKLKVAENSIFSREGDDIYVDSCIDFTQAILGGEIEVPTLSGVVPLQIPKGVQPGQLVRLRGKGLPKNGFFRNHGDQYVRFCIKFPSNVSNRQRAMLEEFEEEIIHENSTSTEGSWLYKRLSTG